jgi:hypothetical protein
LCRRARVGVRSVVVAGVSAEWVLLLIESHRGPPWKGRSFKPVNRGPPHVAPLRAFGHRDHTLGWRPPFCGGHDEYPAVATDGAGISAFRDMRCLQPAPLLNFIVRGGGLSLSSSQGRRD